MRHDGLLNYEFAEEPSNAKLVDHTGFLPYMDLACVLQVLKASDDKIGACGAQGWMDRHHILSLILLNLAGGENVEDIRMLEADGGLCEVFRVAEKYGLSREKRRELVKRFRKERGRTFPSATRIYEYLNQFHNEEEESKREQGKAFIPRKNEYLEQLADVNKVLLSEVQRHHPTDTATLDIDATIQETGKREALYCYEGCKAYQPISVYWAENGLVALSEFRDGNVPAGHEILRILKESLSALPAGVETVRVRMDSAGYQHDVLRYCATGDEGRRDIIEFTVSNDMTAEFRKGASKAGNGEWKPLYKKERGKDAPTGQEWTEVVYVPNRIGFSLNAPEYRYIAIRELVKQGVLAGMEDTEAQMNLPYATITCGGFTYRIKGIVTNMEGYGADLIKWHYQRCGKSEEAHAVMKTDLAGGKLPSGKFGANAAWWGTMLLAYNLHAAMMLLAIPKELTKKRLKAIRFALLDISGRVVEHGRQLYVRLTRGHPALVWLMEMRRKISRLALSAA